MRLTKIKARRLQVLRRSHHGPLPEQSHRRRRAQRLRQVEHHRRRALGDGRAVRASICAATRWRMSSSTARARASRWAPPRSSWCSTTATARSAAPTPSYTEVSLKRQVSRDGTSGYFLNGARCRRKDITQLFLGTGLGSRSYAIIEQGMISRVIEAQGRRHARVRRRGRGHLALQGAPQGNRERASATRARTSSACRTCATRSTSRSATCSARPPPRAVIRR